MSDDQYVLQHQGLLVIHGAIADGLRAVLAAPPDQAMDLARRMGAMLLAHHTLEDTILFPGLRRASRLKSTDVAFLASCDRAHKDLHRLCDDLLAATSAAVVTGLTRDTLALLTSHVAEEEAGLAPDRLRTMVTIEELVEIGQSAERMRDELLARQPGGPALRDEVHAKQRGG